MTKPLHTFANIEKVILFQQRMQNICSDDLYNSTIQAAHAFQQELHDLAQQFGVDVSAAVKVPITPTEAVAQSIHHGKKKE